MIHTLLHRQKKLGYTRLIKANGSWLMAKACMGGAQPRPWGAGPNVRKPANLLTEKGFHFCEAPKFILAVWGVGHKALVEFKLFWLIIAEQVSNLWRKVQVRFKFKPHEPEPFDPIIHEPINELLRI